LIVKKLPTFMPNRDHPVHSVLFFWLTCYGSCYFQCINFLSTHWWPTLFVICGNPFFSNNLTMLVLTVVTMAVELYQITKHRNLEDCTLHSHTMSFETFFKFRLRFFLVFCLVDRWQPYALLCLPLTRECILFARRYETKAKTLKQQGPPSV
jgi:hypothetical protein